VSKQKLIESASRLNANPDFLMFASDFLNDSVIEIVRSDNLDIPQSIDKLKARQVFESYFNDIIDQIEIKDKNG